MLNTLACYKSPIYTIILIPFQYRIMFGNNHLYVLHHPKDPELLKKQSDAKLAGKPVEEEKPTFEQAQEEIAQNSGLLNYGKLTDKKGAERSKGM